MGKLKVTREIADFIYRNHHEKGLSCTQIARTIKDEFGIDVVPGTVRLYYIPFNEVKERRRKYEQRLEVKERREEYRKRPEVKEKQREYEKEYYQRPEVRERQREYYKGRQSIYQNLEGIIIEIFDQEQFAEKELRERIYAKTGFIFELETIRGTIGKLEEKLGENSPIIFEDNIYKLNKASPYWKVCDGYVS